MVTRHRVVTLEPEQWQPGGRRIEILVTQEPPRAAEWVSVNGWLYTSETTMRWVRGLRVRAEALR